jgi:DNA-binding response OmpR family regulator
MNKKVLIVEDSITISKMVKICLEKQNYEVYSVYDGLSAVNTALNIKPDLILLDALIPEINGYIVVEALKQNDLSKNIPVVMMSAKAQLDDIKKAINLGAVDYLVKPFTPEELINKVNKYINGGNSNEQ